MVNKEKTWEERIAHAKKVNEIKKSAGINNTSAVKPVSSDGHTKSWDDRIAHAKRVNAAKKEAEYQKYVQTDEYKWASENEKRRKSGLGYNVNNGQIYSFEPLKVSDLQKSLSWADGEIEKLKTKGGADGLGGAVIRGIGGISGKINDALDNISEGDGIVAGAVKSFLDKNSLDEFLETAEGFGDTSKKINEMEAYKNTIQQYIKNIQLQEDVDKIKSDVYAENKFGEIFDIDNEQKLFFLNAGEEGYDKDSYYERSVRRDNLIKELQNMGYDEIDRYIENYAASQSSEKMAPILEYIKKGIVEHPVIGGAAATVGSVLTSPIKGVGQAFDNVMEALGVHGYKAASLPAEVSTVTQTTVNNVINDTFKNKYAAGFVRSIYNAAVSGTESMLAMGTFGKLGEAVLGLGAATATYKQARERGLSDGQALMNGVAAGLFETLFEHLSLGNLRAFQASPATSLKSFVKNVFIQAGVEAAEEGLTDLANEAYDYLINGGLSQYEQALYNGVTAEEYASQFGLQLVDTLLTGALSGGGMVGAVTAPSAIGGSINTLINDKASGNKIRQYGNVNDVLSEAKEQGGKLAKKAANTEKKLNDKKSVSDRALGQIERNTIRKQRAAAVDDILSGEEYKELSKKEKNAIRSSVLTFFSSNGQVAPEQGAVLQTENGKKVLEAAYNWAFDKAEKKTTQVQENKRSEIRKAISDKNTESLVKNTFTAVNSEGHTVEAGAVRSITDGVFEIVQDESGATAKLTDLNIKDRQARELYNELQAAAQTDVPLSVEAVNVALSMYNTYDNTSARMYALWAHDAYKAGAMGFTFNDFEEMFHGKYKGDITKAQLRELFEAGARNITTKVGLTRIGHKGLSKHQAEQVFIIEQLAKESGLEVLVVDEQLTDSEGRSVNGLYKEGTNRIVLSLQGEYNLILTHAGHEMFHYVKSQSAEMGQYLQDTVINILKSESKYDFDGIYKQVSEAYEGLAENDILEEIAAQYMAVALSNKKTINRIVNEASDTEKSFLQKIVDHLKDFIKNIKDLLKIYGSQDKTVRAAVETPVEQLEYMADMFEKALKEAAKIKKPATETGGVKASLSVIGLEAYNKDTKNKIKMRNGVIVNSKTELRNYVSEALNGDIKRNLHLGAIPENIINQIEKDINAKIFKDKQYTFVVSYDDIRHVSEHFSDVDELTNEIIRLYDILSNYDTVECLIEENGRKKLRLEKTYSHADYRSIEIVSNKTSSVDLISFYVMKKHNEKGSQSVPPATQGSLSGGARLPNSSVPQNAQSVNNNDMQKEKKDTNKYSRTLSSETKERVIKGYGIENLNDSIEVQRKVFATLQRNGFFTNADKTSRTDINEESGMEIETNKSGINETFSYKNFVVNGNDTKIVKLATISSLPTIIKRAKVIDDNVKNAKKTKSGVKYAYLVDAITIEGSVYDVKITIRKSFEKNKFWVHHIYTKKDTAVASDVAQLSESSALQTNGANESVTHSETEVKKKYSRQLSNTEDNIEQLKAENESFADYIDNVTEEIRNKINDKRTPGSSKVFNRDAFVEIARKYNIFYKSGKNGGFRKTMYSDEEIANAMERILYAISEGTIDAKEGIINLAIMQEKILADGYIVEDTPDARAFRKAIRNIPIYLSAKDFRALVNAHGGTKKALRAASFHQLSFKEAKESDEVNISGLYEELRKSYPEFIRDVNSPLEMAEELISAEKTLRAKVHYASEELNFSGELELTEVAIRRAVDILKEAFGVELIQADFWKQYDELIKARKSYDKEKRFNRNILDYAAKRYYEREQRDITMKRILRNTNRLSDMIRNETDKRHIPEKLKEPVMEFLNMIRITNENGREVLYSNGTLNMVKLGNAYAAYYNPTDGEGNPIPKAQYDEDVAEWIEELSLVFGDEVNIKKLSVEDLQKVDKIVTHFSHIIKHENEMFVNGKREKFTNWANISLEEMWKHIKKPEYKTEKRILNAEHGMLTPIYFFKTIGTTTKNGTIYEEKLFKMFRDLQDGQDKWYRNIAAVKKQLADIKERYHYSEDWKRATTEFTLASGVTIKLTAEEIMYMRALNIRETGHVNRLCHLLEGGIIVDNDGRLRKFAEKKQEFKEIKQARKKFEEMKHSLEKNEQAEKDYKEALEAWKKEVTDALKKNLTNEDLVAIFATLTEEQEQYSEALVEMMSTTGADLGNEVSMELFGIRKFTEKNYIPISVAESYLQFSVDKKAGGNIRLKNRSFTKRTTQNANATVYVRSITDVAAEHMQEMSLYNAMTIPIENFTRVYNYQKPVQEEFSEDGKLQKHTGNSYKEKFKEVYGERGIKYFEDFLRDMNGGNQTPARDFTSKMMSMFKRSAVTGSLSVAIQQPSAVVRACALVDAKYFVPKLYNKADYEEMLKYCPVAGIKEIGRFDTGLGQTATEWILDDKNRFLDKADDFLSFLPGMTDRMTWVHIWNAVKRETKANNKGVSGEELLELAAERFRDVIDYTQVYDSTLSRSAYMRDQGTGAKMVTAFMAEPTLSYNLLRDSLLNAREAPQQAVKGVFAFVGATLFNSLLKSFVTALRKDDEETNYWEVYISQFIENFSDDVNPLNMLPIIKDIKSIAEGYDVKRPDMSLIESLVNSGRVITNKLSKGKTPSWEECLSLVGTATALIGLPLNNVFKDFIAAIKTVQGLGKSPDFSIREVLTSEKTSDAQRLYRAIIAKDEDAISRYKEVDEESVKDYMSQGYSESDAILKAADNAETNFHSKVIEGLISEDSRIEEAAEARLSSDTKTYEELLEELSEQGFDRNDVIKAVEKYIASMEDKAYKQSEKKDKSTYTYDDLFRAIDADNMTAAKAVFNSLTKEKTKDTVQESLRDEYSDDIYKAILNGNKNEKQRLINMFNAFDYEYNYAVTLGLRENDKRVLEAAKARYSGDTAIYDRKKAEIVADGFEENDVFNAIEIETEKLSPAKEQDSSPEASYQYEAADLKRYAESFKLEPTRRVIEDFRARGKEDGDIRKELTSAFKKKYIEAWLSGDDSAVMKIRDFLLSCNVGYDSGDFSKWEKEALKK